MKKINILFITVIAAILGFAGIASAHVVVKPNVVGIGSYQTFNMSVPVEKDIPTVGLKLIIPSGLESVMPTVKPGWTITIKKEGTGENGNVTEIDWTGGSIPAGQRDDFSFSAKTPASETSLHWKAYQTYKDGSVVAWDQDPSLRTGESENTGPYSVTTIINDLTSSSTNPSEHSSAMIVITYVVSLLSLIISIKAFYFALKNKK